MAQLLAQIPDPLREDLPDLLTVWRVGTPAIRVLLTIFIGQHRLETATMQIELDHIGSREAGSRQGGEEKLIDYRVSSDPNGSLGSGSRMSGDNDPTMMALCADREVSTVKEVPTGPAFWVRELFIGGQGEARLDGRQIQQGIVFASHHETDSCCDQIHDDGPIAIQPVKSKEGLAWKKTQRGLIGHDHGEGP